ncbi:L-rhamnose operon transcriptional activator RhaR [Paraburkholderia piptadeniae]|uniref:L-rhamnose operon transcriptional activator RhaR n=1 Tax=Paraburkholderia piptadeniae TaxID=1701573 RepID=A0A1N7RSX7_9BURK|nr:AraC family transcriptional regulator [Paraburkholderia piptadeniae]SIT38186.1 L-rhamnose operon transcriptional activator RhaR [Paraburkholderia piptadeniae]
MTSTRFRDNARYWRTPLLPGADLLTAEYHDHEFTPHWHDAYTIPVIEAGAETYRYQGSHYVAEAGSVPVINPGEVHTGSRAIDEGWRYRVLYAPVDFIHALAEDIAGRAQPLPWFDADVIRDPDLAVRLARAHRLLESNDDPLAAETAMLDALSTLLVRYGRTRADTPQHNAADTRVATMKEQLTGDLAAPLKLAELADAVGLSPFHAARLFTRATGLPPHAWRNQIRLQRSLAPLRAGASVADVAAASGFTDQSHFTRHFRRMFGVPPGRWQSS